MLHLLPRANVPVLDPALRCFQPPSLLSVCCFQAIAGIVENWVADYYLAPWPLAGAALSFTARTVNSFWGTAVSARSLTLRARRGRHCFSGGLLVSNPGFSLLPKRIVRVVGGAAS